MNLVENLKYMHTYTVHLESIHSAPHFVMLQPYSKIE